MCKLNFANKKTIRQHEKAFIAIHTRKMKMRDRQLIFFSFFPLTPMSLTCWLLYFHDISLLIYVPPLPLHIIMTIIMMMMMVEIFFSRSRKSTLLKSLWYQQWELTQQCENCNEAESKALLSSFFYRMSVCSCRCLCVWPHYENEKLLPPTINIICLNIKQVHSTRHVC